MEQTKFKGSVTVYFAIAITLIISVIMSVTEIARMNAQKLYLQIATDSAIDSMASLYHRKLYEYYNLYGVEYRTNDGLVNEYLDFIYQYFEDEGMPIGNWYIANIEKENVNLEINELLDNEYLEKEIENYMKLKMIGKTIEFFGREVNIEDEVSMEVVLNDAKNIFSEMKKSELYSEINERYFDFKDSIKILEKYIKKISDYVEKANQGIRYMKSLSTSGSEENAKNVSKKLDTLSKDITSLITNLDNFKNKMRDFRAVVEKSYNRYKADVHSEKYEYNEDIKKFIETEFTKFFEYVDENSPMNVKIENTKTECRNIIDTINEHNRNLFAYVAEFNRIESEIRYERSLSGEDRDNDAIRDLREEKRDLQDTVKEYLKDIKEFYKDLIIEDPNIVTSNGNYTENENLLQSLIKLKDGFILNLVMSNDEVEKIDTSNMTYKNFNILSNTNNISMRKLLLGEYEIDKFNYYNKELCGEWTKSGSVNLETEKMITGFASDRDAIEEVIKRILIIRIAMNVLHIYAHSEKRELAHSFATALFIEFSPIMVEIMTLVIITAWGTAQGLADIKKLLANKKVNFLHSTDSWTLSVESILNVARGQLDSVSEEDDRGFAFSYKDYLRLLLFAEKQSDVDERMVNIIESNIKKEQGNFDFEKLVYSFAVDNKFICKHFFTNFTFVSASSERLYEQYAIRTNAYRQYYEN